MDDGDINSAKMQVQGQMAAQYIQEVMQVCERRLGRSALGRTWRWADPRGVAGDHEQVLHQVRHPAWAQAGRLREDLHRKVHGQARQSRRPRRSPASRRARRWVRRYLDAMAIVSQTWASRAKAQAQMGGGGDGGFLG